ncbi:T9SS type A sorting domain-containing protein [candidate division KSB1 bacterium]|nr:T9SS type A sorting domain-containing protein [candidate division KSB1 bacterium]
MITRNMIFVLVILSGITLLGFQQVVLSREVNKDFQMNPINPQEGQFNSEYNTLPTDGTVDESNSRSIKVTFAEKLACSDGLVEDNDVIISDTTEERLSCAFISTGYSDRKMWDMPLIAYLEKTYDVTVVTDDNIMDGEFTIDDLKKYDFAFMSESISDWKLGGADDDFIKKAPIPFFYTDLCLAAPAYMGIVSAEGLYGTIIDSVGNGGKVIIVDQDNHPLNGGFESGTQVNILRDTDEGNIRGIFTYCVPEVNHIPIAVWAGDPQLTVVFGLEAGTRLYDGLGLTIDPNLVNEHRVAAVGIVAQATKYITIDGCKLIDAGINWILETGTAVEDEEKYVTSAPIEFELSQNYPNPFNPTTEICFSLAKSGHTTLTIYNVIGQVIETIIDQQLTVGTHRFTFDTHNVPSGVYFYQLRSGGETQIKKMILMK